MKSSTGIARREFMQQTAGAGLMLGSAPWLSSCGSSSDTAKTVRPTESRTLYFDLSGAHPDAKHFLVAGGRHHPLANATNDHRAQAAADALVAVQSPNVTHVAESLMLPADSVQLCYIKSVLPGGNGAWTMHSMHHHIPTCAPLPGTAAIQACSRVSAARMRQLFAGQSGGPDAAVPSVAASAPNYCVGPQYDKYKDYFDQAVAMISHHPEICSFDAPTLAYIQQNIICAQIATVNLAVVLKQQGAATPTGGWATQMEVKDPSTGTSLRDKNGDLVYHLVYSALTMNRLGQAVKVVLPLVKNDPRLGVNITGRTADGDNTALRGANWVVKNGTPTARASGKAPTAAAMAAVAGAASSVGRNAQPLRAAASASLGFAVNDVSAGRGFRITDVAGDSARNLSFTVENWYARYLGLYVRFLDSNGQPIALSSLPISITSQFRLSELNGTYDAFIDLINSELMIMGVPVKQTRQSFTIQIPDTAAAVSILAGGLGSGSKTYPATIAPGTAMTATLNIGIPGIFLVMGACESIASFNAQVSAGGEALIATSKALILAFTDAGLDFAYDDPSVFLNAVVPMGWALFKDAKWLYGLVVENVAEGEAEAAAGDLMFGLGLIASVLAAFTTVAQIAETSTEVASAPWTYETKVSLTHTMAVTISHDPKDPAGFPATATQYEVIAVCDGASPRHSGRLAMQSTTRTDPITYTFSDPPLPGGGLVNISVAFYSANGYLVGAGSTGLVSNAIDTASVTITEMLIPLTTATLYSHKQVTSLNSSGKRVWRATTTPPAVIQTNSDNAVGNLGDLVGITLSEPQAALGYSWRASRQGQTAYGSGASGQLYQVANLSFTGDPEGGYAALPQGFQTIARVAYDRASPKASAYYLDASGQQPVVRRVVLGGVGKPAQYDTPVSNKAMGRFQFSSDAFLVHPTGKLISLNSALSKVEVLEPEPQPVADSAARLAQQYVGPGQRDGLLLGPVLAAIAHDGTILVLEQGNNRIQAFDTGINPTPKFMPGSLNQPTFNLRNVPNATFLDLAVEFTGYMYVLLYDPNRADYVMDIYTPLGVFLSSSSMKNAGKIAIDLFRNVFALNYDLLAPGNKALVEPTISQWIPSTPNA